MQPAVLFEVFPYRYYKRGYGPLGGEYGVVHGGAMSPPGAGWLARAVLSLLPTKVHVGAGSMSVVSLSGGRLICDARHCGVFVCLRCTLLTHHVCLPALQPLNPVSISILPTLPLYPPRCAC